MNNEQIINYVRRLIINNLDKNECINEAVIVAFDETNKELLGHINGLIELLKKAKEIIENNKVGD